MLLLLFIVAFPSSAPACVADPSSFCFSPGRCDERVIDLIDRARWSLDVAIYALNRASIAEALVRAKKRGVSVRVLLDHTQAGNFKERVQLRKLDAAEVPTARHHHAGIMHVKMAVADGRFVELGSYNWTDPATQRNDEVLVVLDCPPAAQTFQAEFEKRWDAAREAEGEEP